MSMLEINFWFCTARVLGKRVTHKFFGPLLASEEKGENVGHVNCVLNVTELSSIYSDIETVAEGLAAEKTFSYVPQALNDPSGICYEQRRVESYNLTQSHWPKEPNMSKFMADVLHLMHLRHKSKGIQPINSSHETDMIREDVKKGPHSFQHNRYQKEKDKIQAEKKQNLDVAIEISQLECDLQNKENLYTQLQNLSEQETELLRQQKGLFEALQNEKDTLKKKNNQLKFLTAKKQSEYRLIRKKLTYLEHIKNPDLQEYTKAQEQQQQLMTALCESQKQLLQNSELKSQLELAYKTNSDKIGNELLFLRTQISQAQNQYDELKEKLTSKDSKNLNSLRKEHQRKYNSLIRRENQLKKTYITEGRAPEATVSLPTKETGLKYCIDEAKVIEAMRREQKKNYSLLFNNCATSVKSCLLAGVEPIQEDLKKELEPNVAKNFFKLGTVETTNDLYKWVRQLERTLQNLNAYNIHAATAFSFSAT